MKKTIIKFVMAVLVALFSLNANADKIQIDGIYYYLNDYNQTAKVVESSSSFDEKYRGDITIPASVQYGGTTYKVTSIDNSAFYQCISLNSLIIPEGVTSIGENAFWESGLKAITIPSSVTSIGSMAFWSCGCSKIYISDLEAWLKIPRSTNTPEYAYTLYLNGEILTDVIIPSSITTIKYKTFAHCISIESVAIPSSVTSIGGYAFWGCTGMTSLNIPSSVTSIKSYAFLGCI